MTETGNVRIYVMTHKQFQQQLPNIYQVLHVGAKGKVDLGYLRDDIGDNISDKNPNYCELTGLYWMWKNSTADVVGLCHYRRYFSSIPLDKKLKRILTEKDIEARLKNHDIIVSVPVFTKQNQRDFYCANHYKHDYDLTRDAIARIHPEYIPDFDEYMNGHCGSLCNMFICRKELADKYAAWLFQIYDEMESQVDLSTYDTYQARMYGFMSERLMNVWIKHNRLRVSYAFFASTEVNYVSAIKDMVKGLK